MAGNTDTDKPGKGDADRALQGRPPAPDQNRRHDPHPNDAVHADIQPGWKDRPASYPATKDNLDNIDIPGKS